MKVLGLQEMLQLLLQRGLGHQDYKHCINSERCEKKKWFHLSTLKVTLGLVPSGRGVLNSWFFIKYF
jgi:hypothetical protein